MLRAINWILGVLGYQMVPIRVLDEDAPEELKALPFDEDLFDEALYQEELYQFYLKNRKVLKVRDWRIQVSEGERTYHLSPRFPKGSWEPHPKFGQTLKKGSTPSAVSFTLTRSLDMYRRERLTGSEFRSRFGVDPLAVFKERVEAIQAREEMKTLAKEMLHPASETA